LSSKGDGRELYYWEGDQLIAARVRAATPGEPLSVLGRSPLFRAPYYSHIHAMYDVSRDRTQFIIVTGGARAGRLVVALGVLSADQPGRRNGR